MLVCKLCGEEKPLLAFALVPSFTTLKKHRVQWCSECQKMYVGMRKEQKAKERLQIDPRLFTVSFF